MSSDTSPIKVTVQAHELKSFDLLIAPNERARCLKDLVHVYTGLDIGDKDLISDGRYIADGPLNDYKIADGSKVYLPKYLDLQANTIQINVMMMNSKVFPVLVKPSTTINCLKSLIHVYSKKEYGRIPVDDQELHFNDEELKSGMLNLKDAGIFNGCVLVLRRHSLGTYTAVDIMFNVVFAILLYFLLMGVFYLVAGANF
ncbi:hypothetical protein M3Y97_00484400 [Aphelenchoides bicaudatus]|nr:hypothetical protein M3Y97_00484400 [Aphelenchoides bicaudatus]